MSDLRVMVLGATGMLGRRLIRQGESNGFLVQGLGRDQVDFRSPSFLKELDSWVLHSRPDVLINAAAFTQVDLAETNPDLAFHVNGAVPGALARFSAERKIPFFHLSTDYVFSGVAPLEGWSEEDMPSPINVYGRSKLYGEKIIQEVASEYSDFRFLIIRTSWVYDVFGENFFLKMIHSFLNQKKVCVVKDQWGVPNFGGSLATMIYRLTEECLRGSEKGIVHITSLGCTTWYDFGEMILRSMRQAGLRVEGAEVLPGSSSEYLESRGGGASRPTNSRLTSKKLSRLGVAVPHWEAGFELCFKEWAQGV